MVLPDQAQAYPSAAVLPSLPLDSCIGSFEKTALACIEAELVAGYQPSDIVNFGFGVLVSHRARNRAALC